MSRLAIDLASGTGAALEARIMIRERLADSLPAATLYDLMTVVTELVTNGVRHGKGRTIRVRLSVAADGTVSGEVENDGRSRAGPRLVDPKGDGGLGLHIVGAIADRWGVVVGDSTRVRFELLPL